MLEPSQAPGGLYTPVLPNNFSRCTQGRNYPNRREAKPEKEAYLRSLKIDSTQSHIIYHLKAYD